MEIGWIGLFFWFPSQRGLISMCTPFPESLFCCQTWNGSSKLVLLGSVNTFLKRRKSYENTVPVILQRRGATVKSFGTQLKIPSSTLLHTQVWKWRSEAQQNVEEPMSSSASSSSKPTLDPSQLQNSSSEEGIFAVDYAATELVGEDAGVFDITSQKTSSWLAFTAILGVVLAILYVIWIDPQTGYGGAYIDAISSLTSNHEVRFLILRMYILHSTGRHVLVVIRPSDFCWCIYFGLDDGGTCHPKLIIYHGMTPLSCNGNLLPCYRL